MPWFPHSALLDIQIRVRIQHIKQQQQQFFLPNDFLLRESSDLEYIFRTPPASSLRTVHIWLINSMHGGLYYSWLDHAATCYGY